jgi:hypothetical protein
MFLLVLYIPIPAPIGANAPNALLATPDLEKVPNILLNVVAPASLSAMLGVNFFNREPNPLLSEPLSDLMPSVPAKPDTPIRPAFTGTGKLWNNPLPY